RARSAAVAGARVCSAGQRRFSSLCFGTIRGPQSTMAASDEAALPARGVARAARRAIDVAHERMSAGEALLLYGEGRRSRTRGMQPMLVGVTRYLDLPRTQVLPVGITGTEGLFPIGDEAISPVPIGVRIGAPISAASLRTGAGRERQKVIDCVGFAIADL